MPSVELCFVRDYLTSVCISTSEVTATTIPAVCPKCAVNKKSGKHSCCTSGGAWFNNCGTSGNSNSEHTWLEGLQACKDVARLFSVKAEANFFVIKQTNSTQLSNDVEQQIVDHTPVAAHDVPTANSRDNNRLSYIVVFTSVLLIECLIIQMR